MRLEAYVIEGQDKILVIREDEFRDAIDPMFEACPDDQISENDPRLSRDLLEIDVDADAYASVTTISIY